jgi:predicted GNAT family N-acyltransferase
MLNRHYLSYSLPSPYWQQTCALRLQVFVIEQGVPENLELDAFDHMAQHFIAMQDKQVIATLRLLMHKHYAKLGRLAVSKPFRQQGIATQLMHKAASYCQQQGLQEIQLGAQLSVIEFYEKLGYYVVGDVFIDAGIAHINMIRTVEKT